MEQVKVNFWNGFLTISGDIRDTVFGYSRNELAFINIEWVKFHGYQLGLNITSQFSFILTDTHSKSLEFNYFYKITLVEE